MSGSDLTSLGVPDCKTSNYFNLDPNLYFLIQKKVATVRTVAANEVKINIELHIYTNFHW